jgi:hypothetical protein
MRRIHCKGIRIVGVLLCLGVQLVAPPVAQAYTGGPVKATLVGVEPDEHKVFYILNFMDASGRRPQIWFFDLQASDPTRPVRALSLEGDENAIRHEDSGISEAWKQFLPRLRRLGRCPREYDLSIDIKADSVGVDTLFGHTRFDVRLTVGSLGRSRALDLTVFCSTFIHVRGLYEIPGHSEVIVVVSYRGRAYGCEMVDLPILIPTE